MLNLEAERRIAAFDAIQLEEWFELGKTPEWTAAEVAATWPDDQAQRALDGAEDNNHMLQTDPARAWLAEVRAAWNRREE